jgi:hypothetical protein
MDREQFEAEIQRVAKQYRAEGYEVIVRPPPEQVPPFLVGHELDLLATRGDEKVVAEIRLNRTALNDNAHVARLAELVNKQPGWRFDLVILEQESPVKRIAVKSQEPTDEQFSEMIARARIAGSAGLSDMAIVYAWAVLEAAMRRLRDDAELYGRTTPSQLLNTIYSNGFLERDEFDRAREAWEIRTQSVHGFVAPKVDPQLIEDVLKIATKVMGIEKPQEAAVG